MAEENFCSGIMILITMAVMYFWYNKSRKSSCDLEPFQDKNGQMERRLGECERLFAKTSGGTIISALFISSKVSLNINCVQRALHLIWQRFPPLRMRIYENDNFLWFKEMINTGTCTSQIELQVSKEYTASQWIPVMEEESCNALDLLNGPLWRVTLLKEEYSEALHEYTNCFILTINHSICDGISRTALFSHLLEYLNNIHLRKDVQVESLPFLPSSTFLLGPKVQPTLIQRVQSTLSTVWRKIKHPFDQSEKNLYLNVYPAANTQNPSTAKRATIVTKVINAAELAKIVRKGKENGCTVHSIITASCRLAMARILKKGLSCELPEPLYFPSSFNVATRKYCEPSVPSNQLGCFISSVIMKTPTPCTQEITYDLFWEYTKQCHDDIKNTIAKEEHYQMEINAVNNVSFPLCHSNRYSTLLNISNSGKFTFEHGGKDAVFKCKGVYCTSDEQEAGTLFGHNVVTINGELYWGLYYFPHITTKTQAEELFNLTLDILRQGCVL